jgi:hypothetical protein
MLRRTELNASMIITIYPYIKKERMQFITCLSMMIDDIIHVYDVQCSKIAT